MDPDGFWIIRWAVNSKREKLKMTFQVPRGKSWCRSQQVQTHCLIIGLNVMIALTVSSHLLRQENSVQHLAMPMKPKAHSFLVLSANQFEASATLENLLSPTEAQKTK